MRSPRTSSADGDRWPTVLPGAVAGVYGPLVIWGRLEMATDSLHHSAFCFLGGVYVGEPGVVLFRYPFRGCLIRGLAKSYEVCTKAFVQPQSFKYRRKVAIVCKSPNLHRRCSIVNRSLQMLSYKPIIRYTYKIYKIYWFRRLPICGGGSTPSVSPSSTASPSP